MVKHSFFKKIKPVLAEAQHRTFAGLEPVTRMKPNKFELPITSIRRVMGDKFYDLSNSKDDVIHLCINDNASFCLENIKNNFEQAREMTQTFLTIFQTFSEINGGQSVFSPEFCDQKRVKLTVTTSKAGCKSTLVSMNDMNFMAMFNANHEICGIKNMQQIAEISQKIYMNDENYKKMQVAGNMKALAEFDAERETLVKTLNDLQLELIEGFYKFIKEYGNVDNVEDIYDVQFLFSNEYSGKDDDGNELTHCESLVISFHDAASLNIVALKNKFRLDVQEFLDPEFEA
jgi:hypothetical protein